MLSMRYVSWKGKCERKRKGITKGRWKIPKQQLPWFSLPLGLGLVSLYLLHVGAILNGLPRWGSVVKSLPANAGHRSLIPGSGRFLEEEMATHFSILAWRIPWTEESGGL